MKKFWILLVIGIMTLGFSSCGDDDDDDDYTYSYDEWNEKHSSD